MVFQLALKLTWSAEDITAKYDETIVAEQFYCSLHVKELKVTTTELERQAWDQSRKTTKQLLDWAVTGRLLDSYWKAEITAFQSKKFENNEAWRMSTINQGSQWKKSQTYCEINQGNPEIKNCEER